MVRTQFLETMEPMNVPALGRLFAIADRPDDGPEERLRHRSLIATGLTMSLGGLAWGTMGIAVGTLGPMVIPYGYAVGTALNFWLLSRTRNFAFARTVQVVLSLALPFIFQWVLGGFESSGCVMVWSLLALVASLSFEAKGDAIRWGALFLALTIASAMIDGFLTVPEAMTAPNVRRMLFAFNLCIVGCAVFGLTLYFVRAREVAVTVVRAREVAVSELQEKNRQLAASQAALVQSEKMAALGQLIAGVAHELNTPLGAIRASVSNLGVAVHHAIFDVPDLLARLAPDDRERLLRLVRAAAAPNAPSTSREQRAARRQLGEALEGEGIRDAASLADHLVDMGIAEVGDHLALLKRPDAQTLLEAAYNLSALQRNTKNVDVAAERAAKIVFALKTYAHPGKGGERAEGCLSEHLDTVLTLYQNQIKRGVEVVRNYGVPGVLIALHDALNQVWTNLVHNALQAMGERGTLTVSVSACDGGLEVVVADDGPGIPADVLPHIFEPFYTTKAAGEGTGLGLSISKDIVDAHGGRIDVVSGPGGTQFTVWLPTGETKP